MKKLTDTYELINGVKVPCIGFGTWQVENGELAVNTIGNALISGYRHIDTAAGYGNEESVGIAVKNSKINREELFITSKLHNTVRGYEETKAAFHQTLKNLDMDYLDLYLIHWPNPLKYRNQWQEANASSWKAMEELYKEGKIRAIGISNFCQRHIEELNKTATIAPMVNQIRLCPGDAQKELGAYCTEHNMLLEAYSPLGTGRIFEVEEMQRLADKYGKSVAQICIRWSLQMGFLPLPKSSAFERIKENMEVFDFELSSEDVALIANLDGCCGYARNPDETTF